MIIFNLIYELSQKDLIIKTNDMEYLLKKNPELLIKNIKIEKLKKIAIPPILGIGYLWVFLLSGISFIFLKKDTFLINGTKKYEKKAEPNIIERK